MAKISTGKDIISELSDDLLISILSLLPTEDAVSTTFLSTRWRFVWTKLLTITYLDDKNDQTNSVWSFLDQTMQLHNGPLITNLQIFLGQQCPIDANITKHITKALDRGLRVLQFELLWNSKPVVMPRSLYASKTLKTLELSEKVLVDVPCSSVYLPSLQTLDLINVVYKDEDSHVRLLSSCPVLEALKVERNDDVDDNVRNFTIQVPSLKKLTYMNTQFQENQEEGQENQEDGYIERSLVIDTPGLESLDISDYEGDQYYSIEHMPNLVKASLEGGVYHIVDNLMRSLSTIKYLQLATDETLTPWCSTVYSNLIGLTISSFDPDWCESLLDLLSNCPKLERFMVESIDWFNDERANHDDDDDVVSVQWNKPSSVPKCLLSNLKRFKWRGYVGREDERQVIRYVLEHSKCLTEVVITTLNTTCDHEKMRKELESMSRVSTCVLHFIHVRSRR
ncbi:unnamed protein product [Cochlearia groenlandica]